MSESASARATKEQELRMKIPDAFKDMRGSLLRLQAQVTCEAYFRINLQMQIDELNSISKQGCSTWSMTKPQLTDISPAEVRQEEELEEDLAAAEEAFAAIVKQLHGMRQTLRVEANRRHNSTNLLLALPLAVLRRVIPNDKREARLVCSTLRDAYGTLGTGILLPDSSTDPPTTTSLVNTCLHNWPLPSGVTQLRAPSFLPASTCKELSSTFPGLQALTMLGGMESFSSLAPGSITNLVLASRTQLGQQGQLGQWEDPLWGCCRYLSTLRSLTLTGCTSQSLLADLSPLTALMQLTSLSLLASKGCEASSDDSEVHRGWPALTGRRNEPSVAACDQSAWGVLAALPELARLHLDVRFNYHSDLPAVPVLRALTHLAVLTEATMTQRDGARGVMVPFVKVLNLLPALRSLEVLDSIKRSGAHWEMMAGRLGLRLLLQDLRQRGLEVLKLPAYFGAY